MRNSIKAILNRLEGIRDQVEGYRDNAEEAGNYNKVEKLDGELNSIEYAMDSLQEIE